MPLKAALKANAGQPALLLDEALHRCFPFDLKSGERLSLDPQEVEKFTLRHHRDKGRSGVQVRQVADGPLPSGDAQLGAIDPVMRPLKEALEHPSWSRISIVDGWTVSPRK